jgi:arylsulfate sulfotransferase
MQPVDAGTDGGPVGPIVFTSAPSLVANPNPAAPLAAVLSLSLDREAAVQVTVAAADETWTMELLPGTDFEEPIVGMKPATEYSVSLVVQTEENTLLAGPLDFSTPALPEDFPPLELVSSERSLMEPGLSLFNVRIGWGIYEAALVAVDAEGAVRWYYLDPGAPVAEDTRWLPDGTFLFNDGRCTLRRIDLLGNEVARFHAADYPDGCDAGDSIAVPLRSFHHDVNMLDNGNYLVLSTDTRTVEDYPTSDDDPDAEPRSAEILECVIAEFTPEGEVLKSIATGDLLDPTRIGRDSLSTSWPAPYVDDGITAYDWDHCNSVVYESKDDAYYVSLRHQDAVIKVDRSTESLVWILGTPANWNAPWSDKLLTAVGELQWPFHQHAARVNRFGLGLYDNGRYRAAAFEEPQEEEYSRAVVFAIDEQARTVSEVWSYGSPSGEDSFYSSSMGDADWLPLTDNVLIVNAQIEALGGAYGQILEVTQDGTRVFELNVGYAPDSGADYGNVYTVYRADRIPYLRR